MTTAEYETVTEVKANNQPDAVEQSAASVSLPDENLTQVIFTYLPPKGADFQGRPGALEDFNMSLGRAATPLSKYKKDLKSNGVSDALTQDIIDGLADSPLHDGKTS
jgi:hypothetical protein